MRRILTAAQLDGYSRRKDRTISLRFITQEQDSNAIALIDSYVDQYGYLLFQFEGYSEDQLQELAGAKADLDRGKTKSQRLRAVLYKVWEKNPILDFDTFYNQKMDAIIEHFKSQIDE